MEIRRVDSSTLFVLTLAVFLMCGLPVEATQIKYDFTGTITSVVDQPGVTGGALVPNVSTFSGTIVYDSVPTNTVTIPGLGFYDFLGPYGIKVNVAGLFTDENNPLLNASFDVRQRVLNSSHDAITFFVADRQSIDVNGNVLAPDLGINGFLIDLQRSSGDLFNSNALVTVLPALSDLTSTNLTLRYRVPGTSGPTEGVFQIIGELDTLSPAAVPEPATILLLGTGLAGLAAYRRRSLRRSLA